MSRRDSKTAMKVIPHFVYNPEKTDRGLQAMADILVGVIRDNLKTKGLGEAEAERLIR